MKAMDLFNFPIVEFVLYAVVTNFLLSAHSVTSDPIVVNNSAIFNHSNYIFLGNKQVTNDCSNPYSTECIANGITRMLTNLEHGSTVQLIPGVHLMWQPQEKAYKTHSAKNFTALYLERLNDYLSSMSLRIQLFHPKTLSYMSSVQEKISNAVQTSEARKKMKDSAGIIGVACMFGGSLLLLALTGLGVLAGKAVMTGILAFFFSAMTGLAVLKGDDKSTTYEVVSRPVVSHGHSHTSEIQYEHGGHHGYKRSILAPYFSNNKYGLQLAYRNKY